MTRTSRTSAGTRQRLEAGGLLAGDMDRGAGFEDDPFGDGQALFDPDEVGQELVGRLIAVFFFLLEAAQDELVETARGLRR